MPKLLVLATPIGNLQDLTERGLKALQEADFILAEDTRETRKLLDHFGLKKTLWPFHQHTGPEVIDKIIQALTGDQTAVLVSDAGTPGISDPGGKLIGELVKRNLAIAISPLPGPNAAAAALSISGFPADKFLFLGFPPHKKGRQKFFLELAKIDYTVVFYESPHRIIKTLEAIAKNEHLTLRPLVVARELTKKFETIYRGTAIDILKQNPAELSRGEITIVVGPN